VRQLDNKVLGSEQNSDFLWWARNFWSVRPTSASDVSVALSQVCC